MRFRDLLPAMVLSALATTFMLGGRLLPSGERPVLVRLGAEGLGELFRDPALAEVALVDLPAPGFAVLRGGAAAIRSAFGLTVAWKENPPCSTNP